MYFKVIVPVTPQDHELINLAQLLITQFNCTECQGSAFSAFPLLSMLLDWNEYGNGPGVVTGPHAMIKEM
jgi:hypothetical protein